MSSTTLSEQVTIDRAYFEALLRGQELYLRSQDVNSHNGNNGPDGFVSVKRAEYDELLVTARRHAALRTSLLNGGVGEDILALLSGDDAEQANASAAVSQDHHKTPIKANNAASHGTNGHTSALRAQAPSYVGQNDSRHSSSFGQQRYNHEHSPTWADDVPCEDSSSPSEAPMQHRQGNINGNGAYASAGGSSPPSTQLERQAARTLFLSSLDPYTTHHDITQAIRGGPLVDVHLRAYDKPDKTATVSFLHGADARQFHEHVQKFGLWIKQKRVEVKWAERQFTLQPHVMSRITSGATRNLLIRRCDPHTTEDGLREDLDHISGLAVINIEFVGTTCRIQLNSVHCAMFARTCMMSRAKYKSARIDWDIDECAGPLEKPEPPRKSAQVTRQAPAISNRFQLLNIDGDSDDDDDDDETFTSGISVVEIAV